MASDLLFLAASISVDLSFAFEGVNRLMFVIGLLCLILCDEIENLDLSVLGQEVLLEVDFYLGYELFRCK